MRTCFVSRIPTWCRSSCMSQFRVFGVLGVLSAYDAVCFGRCAALKVETARMYLYRTSSLHIGLHQTTALSHAVCNIRVNVARAQCCCSPSPLTYR